VSPHANDLATDPTGAGDTALVRLEDRPDLQVADDAHDVRGWRVSAGEQEVGTVRHLLVDPTAGRVRFLEVALDDRAGGEARAARVRVEDARLDVARRRIVIDPAAAGAPMRDGAAPDAASRDFAPRDFALRSEPARGTGTAGVAGGTGVAGGIPGDAPVRMTLAEEQLHLGKRAVSAGEAEVRKVVESRPVRSVVPLGREELVIDRYPVPEDSPTEVRVEGDVIRIPVLEERLVVEKRLVPVEEVVIRRTVVTRDETVETELRRERVVIDGQPLPDRAERPDAR
jgi:uncharacterized protein (TIGR02271 family)